MFKCRKIKSIRGLYKMLESSSGVNISVGLNYSVNALLDSYSKFSSKNMIP